LTPRDYYRKEKRPKFASFRTFCESVGKEDAEEIDLSMDTFNLRKSPPAGSAVFLASTLRDHLVTVLAVRLIGLFKGS
jgi:hypothetical protein